MTKMVLNQSQFRPTFHYENSQKGESMNKPKQRDQMIYTETSKIFNTMHNKNKGKKFSHRSYVRSQLITLCKKLAYGNSASDSS